MRKGNEGMQVMFRRLLEASSCGPSVALGSRSQSLATRLVSAGATLVSSFLRVCHLSQVCGWSGELRPTSPGVPGAPMARSAGRPLLEFMEICRYQ